MLHLLHSCYLYLLPKYNCLWNSNYLRFVFLPLFIFFIRDLLHTLPLDSQFTFNLLFCLVFFMAKPMKNPTAMPIKLQIKSSMSKLLPKTICSSSIIKGTVVAAMKILFLLIFSVTKGRKKPIGKNIAMFPMSIVFTQLPIVSSPDNAFMNDGTKLNSPKLKSGASYPTSLRIYRQKSSTRSLQVTLQG